MFTLINKTISNIILKKLNFRSSSVLTSIQKFSNTAPILDTDAWPDYIHERNDLWNKIQSEQQIEEKPKIPIQIKLLDGSVREGISWSTTPYDIACAISLSLSKQVVIARVNGHLWDLDRPFEDDASLELLKFDNDDTAKQVFWHSSAHILGEALERIYKGQLCIGPPIDGGFYYDIFTPNTNILKDHYPEIQNNMQSIVEECQPFERLIVKKKDLLKMFQYNKFKVQLIEEKVKSSHTTVYRCGSLIDLCLGPHIRHTGLIKSFKIYNNSSCYWKGDSNNEELNRIYGISFPKEKNLKTWIKNWEDAANKNHKLIGTRQKLFFFHDYSPGSSFFTPDGAFIYNNLVEFIKNEQIKRDFQEVITPNVYDTKLWKQSGHWDYYSNDMFSFKTDENVFALKPMNCPGHCLIFKNKTKFWHELPIRLSEFGVLHRNESSGSLSGLTRVRRFQQDDSHIFCRQDQIQSEINNLISYLSSIYKTLGFELTLTLSTRPDDYMGDLKLWNQAEDVLRNTLDEINLNWTLNPKDGAFYGPKIDITITDALKRKHQCATIQLDFQLPINFDLNYITKDDKKEIPVIIHCAILGSVERMISILTESYAGEWPFWLSPKQAYIIPVSSKFEENAIEVKNLFIENNINASTGIPGTHMKDQIKKSRSEQYNFILMLGQKEVDNGTLNIRLGNKILGEYTIDRILDVFRILNNERVLKWKDAFSKK